MSTTNNNTANYTVENLVAKYRDYVKEHCPKTVDLCEGKDGKLVEILTPMPPYSNIGEQLLIILYKATIGNKADPIIVDALSEYEQVFYKEALTEDEFAYLCEHYLEVVSFLFLHRDEWNVMGRELRHSISKERIRLVHEYLKPQKGSKIFIADTEYCDLAVQFPNCVVEGFTGWNYKHKEVWALGQIRLLAMGIESRIVPGKEVDDKYTYSLPEAGSVDFVIIRVNENKYFAQTIFGTECTDIEALYDLLKPNGKMLFFSETGNELAGTKKNDFLNFRKRVVNDKSISSIVKYEDKAIIGDGKINYIMLDLIKSLNQTVSIIDETKSSKKVISAENIDSDILWPSFYLANRPSDWKPLSSIAELLPEIRLAEFVKGKGYVLPEDAKDMLLVRPNAFGDSYKDANLWNKPACYANDPVFDESDWIYFYEVKKPCILLSGNNEIIKAGYMTGIPEKGLAYVAGCGLVPKDGIDLRYLAALLFEPTVKDQILTICDGSVNHFTMSLIIDKILVPNHNDRERISFLEKENYKAMISLQEDMKQKYENYRKSIRMRKHALTQSLSSIESMLFALDAYRIKKHGMLADNDCISQVKGTTVKEAFEFLSKSINDMMPTLEHIADVEYSFANPEWIDPEKYVENYISKNEKGWTTFTPIITWNKGHNQADRDIKNPTSGEIVYKKGESLNMFMFPKDALERILNNVISNAQAHGFTDAGQKDYQIRFSWHTDGMSLTIEIENNGTPIPSDRDTASLLEYGVSTALHQDGHNGIGCNEIEDIMQRYDGNVEIISSPNNEFTVKYVLTFTRFKNVKSIF